MVGRDGITVRNANVQSVGGAQAMSESELAFIVGSIVVGVAAIAGISLRRCESIR